MDRTRIQGRGILKTTDSLAEQVRELVSDLFNVTINFVSADSSPATIEEWDSMQHLNLVLALEQRFDIQLAPEEIKQMTDVGKIEQIVSQRIVNKLDS